MAVYYNEFEPSAAAWLRELIKQGLIADGEVDDRSIVKVEADDLRGFTQCHFFAGIGVWSHSLRQAGWSDDLPVWTGSCPCQPFSPAGKQKGVDDERHLWPHFYRLIEACQPPLVFGEQVTGKKIYGELFSPKKFREFDEEDLQRIEEENSDAWLYHVQTDLERAGYGLGHAHFPACSVGAPHQRQRCYWVAQRTGSEGVYAGAFEKYCGLADTNGIREKRDEPRDGQRRGSEQDSPTGSVADSDSGIGRSEQESGERAGSECRESIGDNGRLDNVADSTTNGFQGGRSEGGRIVRKGKTGRMLESSGSSSQSRLGGRKFPVVSLPKRPWTSDNRLDSRGDCTLADTQGGVGGRLREQKESQGSHSGDKLSGGLCGDGRMADIERADGRREFGDSMGVSQGASERESQEWQRLRSDSADGSPTGELAYDSMHGHAPSDGLRTEAQSSESNGQECIGQSERSGDADELADSNSNGCDKGRGGITSSGGDGSERNSSPDQLADPECSRPQNRIPESEQRQKGKSEECGNHSEGQFASAHPCPTNGYWLFVDWLYCRDGKWRSVEPGTFPLADGSPERVGRLRGYGNAIVAPQAKAFIETVMEIL